MKLRSLPLLAATALLLALPLTAQAKKSLCVYDPSGAVGDAFNLMKDYRNAAAGWGVDFELKPYTDEKTAAEDLKAGKCQAALLTGVRVRTFNKFSGSVEAMGAVQNYEQLKTVLQLLGSPKLASKMKEGEFETVGVFPAGAVYLYLRDRHWTGVADLAGKRIATMDFDEAAITMVNRAGATVVPADIGTFAGMFNNGSVDVCYAPATAHGPLELAKGLKSGGGIIQTVPTAQLTMQILARSDAGLPAKFGNASRQWSAENYDRMMQIVRRAESSIPSKMWIKLPTTDVPKYEELLRELRIQLKGKEYDGTMLALLRRVRCQKAPDRAECAEKRE